MMAIITGTPIWVWGILAYIVYVGIQAIKERIVSISKLFIIPIILIALRYNVFLSDYAALCGFSICGGTGLGFWVTTKNSGIILKEISSVKLPGSYITLVFLLSFFLLKYVFGYLSSAHNPIAVEYASVDVIVSSVLTGYFLDRGLYYVSRLR